MKRFIYIVFVVFFISSLQLTVCSVDGGYDISAETEKKFFSSLDPEIYKKLEENGLTTLDHNSVFTKGIDGIKNYFSETLSEKIKGSGAWFLTLLSLLMILSVVSSAFDFSSYADVFSLFCAIILSVATIDKIVLIINCVVSSIALNSKLMLCFVPVFTLLVSLSGNPASALTYNSLMLFFCELMSALIEKYFLGVIGVYFALSIAFSFNGSINLNRFVNSVNRIVTFALGFLASTFTGFLSLKNIIDYSTDSVSVKGVKFLVSNMIPVIGPSLSDAYSTVLGTIHLMKGSLGAVGIFAVIIINIPALVEGAVYCFSLSLLSGVAEMLGLSRGAETLRSFSGCVRILLLVSLFQVFILIVSTGIMLTLKGG